MMVDEKNEFASQRSHPRMVLIHPAPPKSSFRASIARICPPSGASLCAPRMEASQPYTWR